MIGQFQTMRTVIVTGASRGIGAAICRDLRTKGVRVIGVARSSEKLKALASEKIGPGPMEFIAGDVCNRNLAQSAVELATSNGGSLVGLILNAGTLGPVNFTSKLNLESVQEAFNVNVFSCLNWIQVALPALRQSKGRIIGVSSGIALHPYNGFFSYSASKSTLNTLIKMIAQEEKDVTALAVAPGIVETDMFDSFYEQGKSFMSDEQSKSIKSARDGNKALKPEDVADGFSKLVLAAPKERSGEYLNCSDSWVRGLVI